MAVKVVRVRADMVAFALYDENGQVRDSDGRSVDSWEYPWCNLHDVVGRLVRRAPRLAAAPTENEQEPRS